MSIVAEDGATVGMQKLTTGIPFALSSLKRELAELPSAGQMANCLIPFAARA
jgi:hypothetical protein